MAVAASDGVFTDRGVLQFVPIVPLEDDRSTWFAVVVADPEIPSLALKTADDMLPLAA